MKIDSFRELLLKKAAGDTALEALIKYCRDDLIVDNIIEALEKMARSRHKGDAANLAVRHFSTEMDPETEPHMMREAIGHHVSRYKSALGSGKSDIANQHARQAFKLMNAADIAQKHSGGKLSIEHISPHPWERNKYAKQYPADHPKVKEGKYKPGAFVTKTKGLNYSGNDYSFLQQAPHESYRGEVKRHGHAGAYPFEQVRVNGKYIPVEENVDVKGYEPHHFDHHPIMSHFDESVRTRSPERDQQYLQEHEKYNNEHPHVQNYFEQHQKLEAADPEGYKQRGSKPSDPVHKEVPKLNLDDERSTGKPEEAVGEESAEQAAPEKESAPPDYESLANDPRVPETLRESLKNWIESQKGKK